MEERMKIIFPKMAILFLLFAFAKAHGEIYSWVDKEGKKHFGEQVPKEYLKQSTELEVKPVNSMEAAKIPPKVKETNNTADQRPQENKTLPPEEKPAENLSSCELQKRAYEQSVQCYASCRKIENNADGHAINNLSNCSHCVDVKKPDC